MIFKISLDNTAKIVTAGVSILFLGIIGQQSLYYASTHKTFALISIIFLLIIYLLLYIYRPLYYEIKLDKIIIHRPIKNVTIEKKDLVGLIEMSTVMKGAGPILIKINELIEQGKKLIVADSVSITDIEQVVLAINKSDYNILPTGASACAQVLVQKLILHLLN